MLCNYLYCTPCHLGLPFHQHIAVIDCVLPFACRNYSADVTRCAFIGKICPLYHDPRYIQVRRHLPKYTILQYLFMYLPMYLDWNHHIASFPAYASLSLS